jgi:hypothetical protein
MNSANIAARRLVVLNPRLANQSLSRPLNDDECALARALEEIFASGTHAFLAIASALEAKGVKRPSGSSAPWSEDALATELAAVNASLDAAYARDGIGA